MSVLKGHLLLGGLETGHEAVSWNFNVQEVDGVKVFVNREDRKQPRRVRGETSPSENTRPGILSPEELRLYIENWETKHSPRAIGGETTLRTGDYLEVFSDDDYSERIWVGAVCLVACIPDYSSELMPDYEVDYAPLGVDDLAYWHNMHYYEMPAILTPNFGINLN